jgi:amino acid adenylation domain-containing protein
MMAERAETTNVEDVYPLSPMQRGMLFHRLLTPEDDVYFDRLTCTLEGDLDRAAFRRAWQMLIERHAVLRTAFVWEKVKEPVQMVCRRLPLDWQDEDWSGLPPAEREERWRLFLAADRQRGIDLGRPPLLRFFLARTAEREHRFAWTHHHILLDGWSLPLLLQELFAAYRTAAHGHEPREPRLPPAPAYRDYIAWLRRQDIAAAETFWRSALAGFSTPSLVADEPRRAAKRSAKVDAKVDGDGSGNLETALPAAGLAPLRATAARLRLTLGTVLQGALAVVLSRRTGLDDVLFGAVVSGRPPDLPEVERAVGLFINTLAVRVEVDPALPVSVLLSRLQSRQAEARQHEHTPLAEVRSFCAVARDLPLFDTLLVVENFPVSRDGWAPAADGLRVRDIEDEERTHYPLSLSVGAGAGLGVRASFDATLGRATAGRIASELLRLLEQIAADPDRPVAALDPLGEAGRRQVLCAWNDTAAPWPSAATLPELFAAAVRRAPDAVAIAGSAASVSVASGDAWVGYGELARRVSGLARQLAALGVATESRVAVCLPRGVEAIVALLAVLEAGGTFVPLDPKLPAARLAYVTEDSGAAVCIGRRADLGWLAGLGARALHLDAAAAPAAVGESEESERPRGRCFPESLAYVVYTSGSTGRPKGVMGTHAATVNRLAWMWRELPFGAAEALCQKTSLTFVDSVGEIFGPLLQGMPLHVLADEDVVDPHRLSGELARRAITRIVLVPSLLAALLGALPDLGRRLPSLATWVTSGEALGADLARRFALACPHAVLLNLYGSSEVAADATWHAVDVEQDAGASVIGGPLANLRAYVLDGRMEPLAVGVGGELWVGGLGVARGYAGRPELTAERFVPDPFDGAGGGRLYRTGDRARWREDGSLEYLGRLDDQVKIRGQRIEPAEVAAVLARDPAVAEAAVVALPAMMAMPAGGEGGGEVRLVAYVVPRSGGIVDSGELRARLREQLPEVMIPTAWVTLPALPRTASGKLDRRGLPAPGAAAADATREHRPPRTAVEELLAGVWCQVLGRERVGLDDDFFALGGHSLLAAQVLSRVREVLGVDLELRQIFNEPQLGRLAGQLTERLSRGGSEAVPRLAPAVRGAEAPLSYAQQRLWFLERLQPGSGAYHIPAAVRLRGRLDVSALGRSLDEVVRRHEALRTRFVEVDSPDSLDTAVQQVLPAERGLLRVVDLGDLDEAAREREVSLRVRAEVERPFDLAAGPLVRAVLLRLGAEEHALLVTMHHIASDGWSVGVLVRELGELYAAFAAGRPSPLAELAIQYADYALWQRSWLVGEELERRLARWRERLAAVPALDLPTDRLRPAALSLRGAAEPVRLGGELAAVRGLCRREGATLFMALLAAFRTVLWRFGGQRDVAIGTPVANRGRLELERLIGFFVNSLALRTEIQGEESFRDLLRRERETALAAYAHQEVPFERVVEAVAPERSLAKSPLFQVMLTLQNAPLSAVGLPGLSLTELGIESHTSQYEISVVLREVEEGLGGTAVYSTDLYEAATVGRLVRQLGRVLKEGATRPERPLGALDLLAAEERRQVLVDWNRTERDWGEPRPIHELFAARARERPAAIAVASAREAISYGDLARRAGNLARQLAARGLGAEARVGLLSERGVDLVLAILGVLAAGAAYVPLDRDAPAARLAWILDDAGAALTLAAAGLRGRLTSWGGVVAGLEELTGKEPPATPGGGERPPAGATVGVGNAAYVLYTSGSTGQPKGAVVAHAGLANLALAQIEAFGISPASRVLQLASAAFDASVSEWATALAAGATLVVAEKGEILPGGPLEATVARQQVSVLTLPPSVLAWVAEGGLAAVSTLVSAGEACPPELAARWSRGRLFLNAYGPTEATVCASIGGLAGGAVTIGRPLANTRAYVVDPWLRPAPPGTPGELWLGGVGLARGYAGRPALTAERFVPDPFGGGPGGRLYRTGDRARWREEGALEYLGRIDDQVKIRGQRVEPGEVQAALAGHPAVAQAVVAALRGENAGETRLVAYVVPRPGLTVDREELRVYLGARLPAAMVPVAWVVLGALPLLPSGKVDRRALPAPEVEAGGGDRPPRTAVEEILAGIWCEVLGRSRVGVDDDFFALGGHSLLATQVASRVRRRLGVDLELSRLFAAPSLGRLAAEIDRLLAGGSASAPPIGRAARGAEAPLSFAQQRLWFLEQLQPGSGAYHAPAAVRFRGPLDVAALARSLDEVVRRHEVLRTRFVESDGEVHQRIEAPRTGLLAVVDLGERSAAEQEAEVLAGARRQRERPFDLVEGPLLRAALLVLGGDHHVLLVTLHHVVSDGWSVGVLVREIGALYAAFVAGRASPLPPLPIQYADYAIWQRDWLAGGELARQLAYWRERLRGAALLELPLDRPRPVVVSPRGARERLRVLPGTARQLAELCRREGVTLFMALAAAWLTVLWRGDGQGEAGEVVVGTPVANRNRFELEELIGFFVNTLVLRTALDGAASVRDLLARVREGALGAYAHQDAPFERVVEEVAPEREPGRTPLVQVMLTLQNAPGAAVALPEIVVAGIDLPARTAQFELSLVLEEAADGIVGALTYATDLFDATTVRRLGERMVRAVEQSVARPEGRLREIDLLAAAERWQVVGEWSRSEQPYPASTVHEIFRAESAAHPDRVALIAGVAGDEAVSYGELDRRSDRLGRYLERLGVGPEVPVALGLERGIESVAATLGVLKAGGAYVPLDTAYPMERLAWMLEDAAAAVVLTHSALLDRLPVTWAQTVCLDRESEEIAAFPAGPGGLVGSAPSPDGLAYVMYTSGSTGRPRGVAVSHRAIVRLLRGGDLCSLGLDEVLLHLAPETFDAAVFELWGALLNGGRCVLAPPGPLSGWELAELVARHGVTTAWLTSALFHAYLDEDPRVVAGLRQLLIGGDVVSPGHVRRAAATLPPEARLVNGYGPTEATTFSTRYSVAARAATGLTSMPIGRPIASAQTYVLDGDLAPQPLGVAGELAIGGPGLARGYLNRPELTAERFVPHPFAGPEEAGARLYRTGDRVRFRADGNLEFLGRRDEQVKIRGHRIEPGEIVAALEAYPGVRAAAVVAREDRPGQKRLVAYVVGEDGRELVAGELRAHLGARLPEPLIPTAFVALAALPLSPHGKLDRDALPAPAVAALEGTLREPRDMVEARLLRLWRRALGTDEVGITDSFFTLGGDSLVAVALAHAISRELAVPFGVAALFLHPTIEAQAAYLRRAEGGVETQLVPLHLGAGPDTVVLVHHGGGTVLAYLDLARRLSGFRVYGIQAEALVTGECTLQTVEAMADRYVALVEALRPTGACLFGGWSSGGLVAFEMARRRAAAAGSRAPVLLFDTYLPAAGGEAAVERLADADLVYEMLQHPDWFDRERMRQLEGDALLARCLEAARSRGALPPDYDLSRARRHLAAVRTNLLAAARYRPEPYDGEVLLFRAEGDAAAGETLGWERLARGGLRVVPVSGIHSRMMSPANLDAFASAIERAGRAVRPAPPSALRPLP